MWFRYCENLVKTGQFFLDSLPFVLLGVMPEVIGTYFVFYAINGFFQHCNIDLKFGWMSRVFSTAELHRWHHASQGTAAAITRKKLASLQMLLIPKLQP